LTRLKVCDIIDIEDKGRRNEMGEYLVALEGWHLGVISDTFHDLELDAELSEEEEEVLRIIDGYILQIEKKYEEEKNIKKEHDELTDEEKKWWGLSNK